VLAVGCHGDRVPGAFEQRFQHEPRRRIIVDYQGVQSILGGFVQGTALS
jgi:hypothetical protein